MCNLSTPSSKFNVFLKEFSNLIQRLSLLPFIILCDFYVNVNNQTDTNAKKFLDLLHIFNLSQNVSSPTHISGHILDLIITPCHGNTVTMDTPLVSDLISDHFAIECNIQISSRTEKNSKTIISRKLKSLDIDAFRQDISKSELITHPSDDLDRLVDQYNTCLSEILDKHAPKRSFIVKEKKQPWYSDEIHSKRKEKRCLQRKFRKDRSDVNLNNMLKCRNDLKELIYKTKIEHNSRIIAEASHDQSTLFKKVNSLLHKNQSLQLPNEVSASEFSDKLNNFFVDKIDKIRSEFPDTPTDCFGFDENVVESTLSTFRLLGVEDVKSMIKKCPNKSCSLDPIPTPLLKASIDVLAPAITNIINGSLQKWKMPKSLKHAIVTPVSNNPICHLKPSHFVPLQILPFFRN